MGDAKTISQLSGERVGVPDGRRQNNIQTVWRKGWGARWATSKLYLNCREKGLGVPDGRRENCISTVRRKGWGCQMGDTKTVSQLSEERVGCQMGDAKTIPRLSRGYYKELKLCFFNN